MNFQKFSLTRLSILLALIAALSGCDKASKDSQTAVQDEAPVNNDIVTTNDSMPGDINAPMLNNMSVSASQSNPLEAMVSLATDESAKVTLNVFDGNKSWSTEPKAEFSTSHQISVSDLEANRVHSISAVLTDMAGNVTETGAVHLHHASKFCRITQLVVF